MREKVRGKDSVRTIIKEIPGGKRPHGRARLHVGNTVCTNAVKKVEPTSQWRTAVIDRENWSDFRLAKWSQWPETLKKRRKKIFLKIS